MKSIIISVLLFSSISIYSQSFFESGEIFYRDGTNEKGYIKIKYSEIKFKKKITDKKHQEYTYRKVKKLILADARENKIYEYKIIKDKKKSIIKLLNLVLLGDVALYQIEHFDTVGNYGLTYSYKGASYYLVESNNESFATFIGSKSIAVGRKNIKKGLIKYFKDCPDLINKLKNKKFKKRDIVEVVEYYNENCGN